MTRRVNDAYAKLMSEFQIIDGIQIGGATVDFLDPALFFCPA